MPGTWETSPAPSDSVAREAFDPQRPLSSNAIPRGSGRSWPNLAAKPTLRTALGGFTVDPMRARANLLRLLPGNRGMSRQIGMKPCR